MAGGLFSGATFEKKATEEEAGRGVWDFIMGFRSSMAEGLWRRRRTWGLVMWGFRMVVVFTSVEELRKDISGGFCPCEQAGGLEGEKEYESECIRSKRDDSQREVVNVNK